MASDFNYDSTTEWQRLRDWLNGSGQEPFFLQFPTSTDPNEPIVDSANLDRSLDEWMEWANTKYEPLMQRRLGFCRETYWAIREQRARSGASYLWDLARRLSSERARLTVLEPMRAEFDHELSEAHSGKVLLHARWYLALAIAVIRQRSAEFRSRIVRGA